jgi:hypothetical protein
MTVFRPCFGCTARNDCEIKKAAVKALRGQPITLAKIRCDLPWTKYFPPGTRVKVEVWDWREYDGGENGPSVTLAAGTVISKSTKKVGKFLVHLDAKIMSGQETEIEFRAAWPKEVVILDEPPAAVCDQCGRGMVHGKRGMHDHEASSEAPFYFGMAS